MTRTKPWRHGWAAALLVLAGAACAHGDKGDREGWGDRGERGGRGAFSVALVGDMPYAAAQVAPFDAVIADINDDESIRFVLHAGDIKGGSERCDDSLIRARHAQLGQLRAPLIYTPGDNEWTDCHRTAAGAYYPPERLAFVRQLFFPNPWRSLGRKPLAVTPQSSEPGYEAFVENVLFERRGVVFATLHVVGSSNDLAPWSDFDASDTVGTPRADRLAEFAAREKATLAWIDRAFDTAQAQNAAGVLMLMQANPGIERLPGDPLRVGFEAMLARIKARALAFGKPVALVHGDNHELLIDQPLYRDAEPEPKVPLFTRVQGIGSPRIHWVKITIDPQSRGVFRFEPQLVHGNY